jgi:hypothetical protein
MAYRRNLMSGEPPPDGSQRAGGRTLISAGASVATADENWAANAPLRHVATGPSSRRR